MASMITAKIGTPRMKAAKLRCSWATAQTASREPSTGKARYAGSLAASWASTGKNPSKTRPAVQSTRMPAATRARDVRGGIASWPATGRTADLERDKGVCEPSRTDACYHDHKTFERICRGNPRGCQGESALAQFDTPMGGS